MVKKVNIYQASDGKEFKTKKGAENHERKLVVNEVIKQTNMSKDEITERINKIKSRNVTIATLIRSVGEWTEWPIHLIRQINKEFLAEPAKKTLYIMETKTWRGVKEEILFEEENFKRFRKPDLHVGEIYKVERVEDVDEYTRKVYYENKYTEGELIKMKLDKGENLDENEVRDLMNWYPVIYEEEGEDRRWSRSVLSVVDVDGVKYAVDWDKGLTENQENGYYEQPYKVELTEEEITITKTIVKPI